MGLYQVKYTGRFIVEANNIDDVVLDDLFNGTCRSNEIEIDEIREATEFDVQSMIMDFTDN